MIRTCFKSFPAVIKSYRSHLALPATACCLIVMLTNYVTKAATLPPGFSETLIATGLPTATAMDISPDGRLFVCEQGGDVRLIKNGVLLPTSFLTVAVHFVGEQGLLGIAFDPNFATNSFVYVYYTALTPSIHNRVSRFTASGDQVVPGSEFVVLDLEDLGASNHNGGAIHFGPDGKLYVAVGDNTVSSNSQTLNNRLGKVLRVNADGSIPTDNPFFNIAAGANRAIWALGLRNPFTFTFQPGATRMFINDVGLNDWEEINLGIAGANYGWPVCEGACSPPKIDFRDPIFQYGHGSTSTTGCAIVGASFYNPATIQFPPSYIGKYFFADICSGWIRVLDPSSNLVADFASDISLPVDVKIASDGSLYYLSFGLSSEVFHVQFTGSPTITTQPTNQTVLQGQPATFSVIAGGGTPHDYQWQRNQVNIPGATSSSYTLSAAAFADDGARFRVVVTNAFGSVTSDEATLTVNAPPNITGQPANQTVLQGQPANFGVTAIGSATLTYQWQRNQVNISAATSSSFTIATTTATDNGARFRCVVTNSFGSVTTDEATLTVNAPPNITGQPANQTVIQGQPVNFGVTAIGSATLTYQWQRNQVNISAATSSSYTLSAVAFADDGARFRVVVTNAFGSVTSDEATLTVNAPPNITGQPANQTVIQGQPANFGVTAIGSATLTYQWQRNQVNISAATASSFTIATTTATDNSARFRCIVTNSFGAFASDEATLTVQPPLPVLLTEGNTDLAVALDSVTMFRNPFPLMTPFNFSSDNRTRVTFFALNLDLLAGETSSAVTVRAEDGALNVYTMTVEFLGTTSAVPGVSQLTVLLPGNLPTGQDVFVTVTLHGQTSNRARIRIR